MDVLEGALLGSDVAVDEIEEAFVMAEGGCPDAAGIGDAAHIDLADARQRVADGSPVHQIAGMKERDAGEPLEGAGGEVVIEADANEAWVGVKAWKNGVGNERALDGSGEVCDDRFLGLRFRAIGRSNHLAALLP